MSCGQHPAMNVYFIYAWKRTLTVILFHPKLRAVVLFSMCTIEAVVSDLSYFIDIITLLSNNLKSLKLLEYLVETVHIFMSYHSYARFCGTLLRLGAMLALPCPLSSHGDYSGRHASDGSSES